MKLRSIGSQLAGADELEVFGNFKRSSVQSTPKYMFIWTENRLSSTLSTSKTYRTRKNMYRLSINQFETNDRHSVIIKEMNCNKN